MSKKQVWHLASDPPKLEIDVLVRIGDRYTVAVFDRFYMEWIDVGSGEVVKPIEWAVPAHLCKENGKIFK